MYQDRLRDLLAVEPLRMDILHALVTVSLPVVGWLYSLV
jgi:hypothetical protein